MDNLSLNGKLLKKFGLKQTKFDIINNMKIVPRHFAHTNCNGANASEEDVVVDDEDVCAVADVDASDVWAIDVDAFVLQLFCKLSPNLRFDDLIDEAFDRKLAVTRLNGASKSLSFMRPSFILSSFSSKSSSSKLELSINTNKHRSVKIKTRQREMIQIHPKSDPLSPPLQLLHEL